MAAAALDAVEVVLTTLGLDVVEDLFTVAGLGVPAGLVAASAAPDALAAWGSAATLGVVDALFGEAAGVPAPLAAASAAPEGAAALPFFSAFFSTAGGASICT